MQNEVISQFKCFGKNSSSQTRAPSDPQGEVGAAANWTPEQQISELYNYRAEAKRKKNQSFKYSEESDFAKKKSYPLRMC